MVVHAGQLLRGRLSRKFVGSAAGRTGRANRILASPCGPAVDGAEAPKEVFTPRAAIPDASRQCRAERVAFWQ